MLYLSLFIQGTPWMLGLLFQFYEKESQGSRLSQHCAGFWQSPPPPYPTTARSWLLNAGFSSYPLLALSLLFKPAAFPSCSHFLGCTTALPPSHGRVNNAVEWNGLNIGIQSTAFQCTFPLSLSIPSLFIHYLHAIPSQSGDQKTPTSMLNQWYSTLNRQLGMERRLELRTNLCEAETRLILIKGYTHTWIYWRNKFFKIRIATVSWNVS